MKRISLLAIGLVALAACNDRAPTAPAVVPDAPQLLIVPAGGYVNVSTGSNYACARRTDTSAVVCWGQNDYNQLAAAAGAYTQVSAGLDHACAIRASDAAIVCWGSNGAGERVPPAGAFSQVSAGNSFGCAIRSSDGSLACWGANSSNQTAAPAGAYTKVSAGILHSCAIRADNSNLRCWGFNSWGQSNPPTGAFTQVSAGEQHACGIRAGTGAVACWGSTYYGQSAAPAGVYTSVGAGWSHSCAIRASDGAAVCWGNFRGGLTQPPAGAYREVSVGSSNACAVRQSDNALVCWGYNDVGQSSPPALPTKHVAPTAKLTAPFRVVALDTFTVALGSAQVPGYPAATTFTYQFDCGDGSGYRAASSTPNARCATRVAGTRAVRGKVIDQSGDTASYAVRVAVEPRPQTLSFTSTPPNPAYVYGTYVVTARSTSGLPLTIKAGPPNVCTITGGSRVSFVASGGCSVTADQAGDSTYHLAQQVRQSISVNRVPQTITFGATPASAIVGSAVTLSATGGASGQPVVLSSLTPAVCTVSGATAQLVAIGSCIVAANQTATPWYDAAPQVTRTIAVVWSFAGFYAPVQNGPVVNAVTAGNLVEIPFSLAGNRGTNVLALNAPSSQAVACDANATKNKVAAAKRATAGLTFDAATARYTYTWATDRAWGGTCRAFTLTLADGTTHTLQFSFK